MADTSCLDTEQTHDEGLTKGKPYVYVIGQEGILEECRLQGIPVTQHPYPHLDRPDHDKGTNGRYENNVSQGVMDESDFEALRLPNTSIKAVVVGMDRHLNYKKLAVAHRALTQHRTAGDACRFIATNDDATYPSHGTLFPGTGVLVKAIEASTQRRPDAVAGKPHAHPLFTALRQAHPEAVAVLPRVCMVGDRLDTDVAFGHRCGVTTLMVLTGVATMACVDKALLAGRQEHVPRYIVQGFAALHRAVGAPPGSSS